MGEGSGTKKKHLFDQINACIFLLNCKEIWIIILTVGLNHQKAHIFITTKLYSLLIEVCSFIEKIIHQGMQIFYK